MTEWEKAVQRAMGNRESYGMVDLGDDRIRVHYYEESVDTKLDAKLARAMKKVGYKWYASGFLFSESRRDNCFKLVEKR